MRAPSGETVPEQSPADVALFWYRAV